MERTGELKCVKCDLIHTWDQRISKEGDVTTSYFCPKCGEESYYNLDEKEDVGDRKNTCIICGVSEDDACHHHHHDICLWTEKEWLLVVRHILHARQSG